MAKSEKLIEAFIEGNDFVMENVKVKWARVQADNPDTKYDPCWKVDIILTPEWKEHLEESGFKVHQDLDGDWILRLKKKVKTRLGKSQQPPKVVGRDGRTPFEDEIGNGSVCNVVVFAKYQPVAGTNHLAAYLDGLQVVDLVPYGGGAAFSDLTKEDEE